jgi:hypothetical protein
MAHAASRERRHPSSHQPDVRAMRVVIRGGMVVTPEKGGVRAERGAIVVDGDRIALPWSLRCLLASRSNWASVRRRSSPRTVLP